MPSLAPSSHWVWVYSYWILKVKRAQEMASIFGIWGLLPISYWETFCHLSTRYFQKFRPRGQRLYLNQGSKDRRGADRIIRSSQTNFSVYSSLILPSILVKTGLAFPLAGCSFPIDSSSSIVSLSNRHFTAEIGFQICSISDWLTNQTNESARRKPFWISQFHYKDNKSYWE